MTLTDRLLCPDHEEENFAPACFTCSLIEEVYKLRQERKALLSVAELWIEVVKRRKADYVD